MDRIPTPPPWLTLIVIGLAALLLLKHLTWLLFIPVVLLALWESARNAQMALRGLGGHEPEPIGVLPLAMAGVLGLALFATGWFVLALLYAGSWAARWHVTKRRT